MNQLKRCNSILNDLCMDVLYSFYHQKNLMKRPIKLDYKHLIAFSSVHVKVPNGIKVMLQRAKIKDDIHKIPSKEIGLEDLDYDTIIFIKYFKAYLDQIKDMSLIKKVTANNKN